MVENTTQNEIGIVISVSGSVKINKYWVCKEDYVWNTCIGACECEKDLEIGGYLKDCTCKKSLIKDLLDTCD